MYWNYVGAKTRMKRGAQPSPTGSKTKTKSNLLKKSLTACNSLPLSSISQQIVYNWVTELYFWRTHQTRCDLLLVLFPDSLEFRGRIWMATAVLFEGWMLLVWKVVGSFRFLAIQQTYPWFLLLQLHRCPPYPEGLKMLPQTKLWQILSNHLYWLYLLGSIDRSLPLSVSRLLFRLSLCRCVLDWFFIMVQWWQRADWVGDWNNICRFNWIWRR
jgi:hypothetical protein